MPQSLNRPLEFQQMALCSPNFPGRFWVIHGRDLVSVQLLKTDGSFPCNTDTLLTLFVPNKRAPSLFWFAKKSNQHALIRTTTLTYFLKKTCKMFLNPKKSLNNVIEHAPKSPSHVYLPFDTPLLLHFPQNSRKTRLFQQPRLFGTLEQVPQNKGKKCIFL